MPRKTQRPRRPAHELNAAPVLEQVRPYHRELLAFVLWKLSRDKPVMITTQDIEDYGKEGPILFVHGKLNGFELSLISPEAAERIAALQKTKGNA